MVTGTRDVYAAIEILNSCSEAELQELIGFTSEDGYAAIHLAARQGMPRLVRALLRKSPSQASRQTGHWCKAARWTALHIATQGGGRGVNERGRADVVTELLRCMDADAVNAVTHKGNTALHHAAVLTDVDVAYNMALCPSIYEALRPSIIH